MTLPARPVVGVLHPGAMGAALGAALVPAAARVVWAESGRSAATARRAAAAGLVGVPDLAELVRHAHLVVSICPPHAALDVARGVADALGDRPDRPLYLDANAVAPATVGAIAALLGAEHVVDGSVIGPPPREPGRSVLWLSGARAREVAALFTGSALEAGVLGTELGAASALKACYAVQTKGITALWLAIDRAAGAYGVRDALRTQLTRGEVDYTARVDEAVRRTDGKAWRWAGEMDEAAAAFAAVGVPDGFSRAAGQVFRERDAPDPSPAG